MKTAIVLLVSSLVPAWPACLGPGVLGISPGVTPPKLISKVEPEYSLEARAAGIQGTVVVQVVVDERGKPSDVTVLSPLGFGLDERAGAAIEKSQFTPAKKNGKPIKALATIEKTFRFPGHWFDERAEGRRTRFNLALQGLRSHDPTRTEPALRVMQDLARQEYPAAMDVMGRMLNAGQYVEKDPEQGARLIMKAAEMNYAPAVFDLGILYLDGENVARDPEHGLMLIHDAALMGSLPAQYFLAQRYEAGNALPRDAERARHYFRLCAARGDSNCQLRLGKLLLDLPAREDRDYVQAVAWLQLAADRGNGEARTIAAIEASKLTPEQEDWMNKLKAQLVRPQ
jgi:TonB family protein